MPVSQSSVVDALTAAERWPEAARALNAIAETESREVISPTHSVPITTRGGRQQGTSAFGCRSMRTGFLRGAAR